MVSTTGEQWAYFELDEDLMPQQKTLPDALKVSVERIAENCEPSLCSVLFMGGAGGSLRAGVTENPVGLTRSVQRALTHVTCGGAPAYRWPGGGITVMADVMKNASEQFWLCTDTGAGCSHRVHLAPVGFRGPRRHMDHVVSLDTVSTQVERVLVSPTEQDWPLEGRHFRW